MRDFILASRRTWTTGSIVAALVIVAFVPWSTRIVIPAVVEHEEIQRLFPKRAGVVRNISVALGSALQPGDVVARLDVPELEHDIRRTQLSLEAVLLRLDRRSSSYARKLVTA